MRQHILGGLPGAARRTCVATVIALLLAAMAPAASPAQAWTATLLYATDFSTDPNWTTNKPSQLYWDEDAQRYHFALAADSDDYAYLLVPWTGEPFRLSFDLTYTDMQFGSNFSFGISVPDPADQWNQPRVRVATGYDWGGPWFRLEANNTNGGGSGSPKHYFPRNMIYRFVVTLGLEDMRLTVRRADTGGLIGAWASALWGYTSPNFAGMDRLRFSAKRTLVPEAVGAIAEGYIDNLELVRLTPSLSPPVAWERDYGTSHYEHALDVQSTADGGFILAGVTEDLRTHGPSDAYVVKTDAFGNSEWQRTYGGIGNDSIAAIRQTDDGGFIMTGATSSFETGSTDALLIKIDALGNIEWQHAHGSLAYDSAAALRQTDDGRFIIAGTTDSIGAVGADVYLLKTDMAGNVQWQRAYGGEGSQAAESVQQTSDGGFIVAGWTSEGVSGVSGVPDAMLLKADASGDLQWMQSYGEMYEEKARSVQQTSDGGFIFAGSWTSSWGSSRGRPYVVKTDSMGNTEWQRIYSSGGDLSRDTAVSVEQLQDGGFIIAGTRNPYDSQTGSDVYVAKLDSGGSVEWRRVFGGVGMDLASAAQHTRDGGLVVAGLTSYPEVAWNMYLARLLAITAETSLGQSLAAHGLLSVDINVDRVRSLINGVTVPLNRGLGAYEARLDYDPSGISVVGVTGVPPFDAPAFTIDTPSPGRTSLAGYHSETEGPQGGAVARIAVRLMGDRYTSYNLVLEFGVIADVLGDPVTREAPVTMTYQRGDADKDGAVTVADALFIAQYLAKMRPFSDLNAVNAASVFYDGDLGDKITIVDALYIAQMLAGLRNADYTPK